MLVEPRFTYDTVIAGAGIVGASIARHLADAGHDVAVIDATGPAAAASGASDGAVSLASKRPGLMAELAAASLAYCKTLSRPGGLLEGVFHERPSFLFSTSEDEDAELDRIRPKLAASGGQVGIVSERAGGAVEGVGPDVRRVVELTGEGHMLGYAAVRRFLDHGSIARHWPCALERYEEGDEGVDLFTSAGRMRCRRLVLACGTGTVKFCETLDIVPRSGQLIVTDRAAPGEAALPGAFTSAAYLLDKTPGRGAPRPPVVIDPLTTGQFLIGSSRETGGSTRQTDFATVRQLLKSAVACLPALAQRRVLRVFAGVRAASGDGVPMVGRAPGRQRVFVATGFEGDGICLSPLMGRMMANWLTSGLTEAGFEQLDPARMASA